MGRGRGGSSADKNAVLKPTNRLGGPDLNQVCLTGLKDSRGHCQGEDSELGGAECALHTARHCPPHSPGLLLVLWCWSHGVLPFGSIFFPAKRGALLSLGMEVRAILEFTVKAACKRSKH